MNGPEAFAGGHHLMRVGSTPETQQHENFLCLTSSREVKSCSRRRVFSLHHRMQAIRKGDTNLPRQWRSHVSPHPRASRRGSKPRGPADSHILAQSSSLSSKSTRLAFWSDAILSVTVGESKTSWFLRCLCLHRSCHVPLIGLLG